MINALARNDSTIEDVLILKPDGLLGEGTLGFVYEGSQFPENYLHFNY